MALDPDKSRRYLRWAAENDKRWQYCRPRIEEDVSPNCGPVPRLGITNRESRAMARKADRIGQG